MAQVYLALGSNQGDRKALLHQAIDAIDRSLGRVDSISSFIETEPWGFTSPHPFLNAALSLTTQLTPEQVLDQTQQIERQLGRKQKSSLGNYQDRPIDIDLLLYDSLVLSSDRLTLPHPLLHRRGFVLDPLAEIAPHLYHPILGKTIRELQLELHTIDTSQPSL